jgi:hypothetical protein
VLNLRVSIFAAEPPTGNDGSSRTAAFGVPVRVKASVKFPCSLGVQACRSCLCLFVKPVEFQFGVSPGRRTLLLLLGRCPSEHRGLCRPLLLLLQRTFLPTAPTSHLPSRANSPAAAFGGGRSGSHWAARREELSVKGWALDAQMRDPVAAREACGRPRWLLDLDSCAHRIRERWSTQSFARPGHTLGV